MSQKKNFYNINNLDEGIKRKLGQGLETSIFCGDQAMVSIVTIEPNCVGQIHSHPEEQWGFMLEGSGFMAQTGDVKFGNTNNSEFNLSLAGTGG